MGRECKHKLGGFCIGVFHDFARYVLDQLPPFILEEILYILLTKRNGIMKSKRQSNCPLRKSDAARSGQVGHSTWVNS